MLSPAPSTLPGDHASSLLATIGHELRNPLSCILAQAETLQDGLHGSVSPAQHAVLQSIQNEVHRTLALVNDLADLGRIDANALNLRPTACHLETIQQQALEGVMSLARARSVQLLALPAPRTQIKADENRLRQVVSELLAAALLSGPVGAQAWLAIAVQGGTLQVLASSGLSQEELAQMPLPVPDDPAAEAIFGRLLSLKPLGISLLCKLVQLQGGTLAARTTPAGAVCLGVTLPVAEAASSAAPQSAAPPSSPASQPPPPAATATRRKPIILLADDQPTLVSVTTHFLENLGFQVYNARDGQEAVLKTQQLRPDLILMDVRMPVLEGPQAIQALRGANDPYLRTVPIISLSGQPGSGDRDRCLAAGATAHLSKPFGVKELDAAIRQFVTPPAA